MSSPKKNFIYNLIYQLLILICPLLTTPYLSRVVGTNGVGTYSYIYSIVYYFMLVTLLGVNNYGNRTIAKTRDDSIKLSKAFWEIYYMQLIIGIVMLFIYLFSINYIFDEKLKFISFLASFFILSAILDINWLFFGLEEFKKTIIRNSIVKILSVVLVFLFVKNDNDIWKYMLIMSGSTCISQLVLWFFIKGKIKIVKVSFKDVLKHLKPNIVLFIPVIAVSLYKMMDKVMLGVITSMDEVGFYENAEKIINIPLVVITALGTVMLPRISNMIEKGNTKKMKEYIYKSFLFIGFITLAMAFGLAGIGENFAPWFFGSDFEKTGFLIVLLSSTIPFIGFANVIRTQYLIPNERDKIYIKSVIYGAIINFIANIIFIPSLKSIGACIGTISAEIMVMIYQTISVRRELPIKEYFRNIMPFFFKSIIMLMIISIFNYININAIIRLMIQIMVGGMVYSILNYKYIYSMINFKKIKILFSKR
ncbi:MAG: oligosaccharide flippase family protein [Tenericutes bacterium]|nr:oligosaccharide flippase family protein [Mycoplasmatota bacterium]